MGNCVINDIRFLNNDKNEIIKLAEKIKEFSEQNILSCNCCGGLATIASNAGLVNKENVYKDTGYNLTGRIDGTYFVGNCLYLQSESSCEPSLKLWVDICKKYSPDTKILYSSEECGEDIYITNDEDILGRYLVDPFDLFPFSEFQGENIEAATSEEVVETLQKLLNTSENNIDEILDKFEKSDLSDKMGIHKWEFVDINDLN